jgi:hypothetical protein
MPIASVALRSTSSSIQARSQESSFDSAASVNVVESATPDPKTAERCKHVVISKSGFGQNAIDDPDLPRASGHAG